MSTNTVRYLCWGVPLLLSVGIVTLFWLAAPLGPALVLTAVAVVVNSWATWFYFWHERDVR